VKVVHRDTGVPVDVSFNDGLGVRNSKILNYWLDLQGDEARKLALFVRKWFEMSTFREDKFHKTLDILVIYFLQMKNRLPSYHQIRELADRPVWIGGYRTGFDEDLDEASDYGKIMMSDYKNYIKSFFKFYMDFDFGKYVVCPFVGNKHVVKRENLLTYQIMQE
jgi:DNA polymerase sigma